MQHYLDNYRKVICGSSDLRYKFNSAGRPYAPYANNAGCIFPIIPQNYNLEPPYFCKNYTFIPIFAEFIHFPYF